MLELEIWADVACPWCYIGQARLAEALASYEHAGEVAVHLRSFELDPGAPAAAEGSIHELLAAKYGRSPDEARTMVSGVVETARAAGLTYDPELQRPGNSFLAHQLVKLAGRHGLQAAMADRLYRAYFAEGALMSDTDTLAQLAAEVGLDVDEVRRDLGAQDLQDAVRRDEADAARLGISGVPCFVINRSSAVSGAQPAAVLVAALEQARLEQLSAR